MKWTKLRLEIRDKRKREKVGTDRKQCKKNLRQIRNVSDVEERDYE